MLIYPWISIEDLSHTDGSGGWPSWGVLALLIQRRGGRAAAESSLTILGVSMGKLPYFIALDGSVRLIAWTA